MLLHCESKAAHRRWCGTSDALRCGPDPERPPETLPAPEYGEIRLHVEISSSPFRTVTTAFLLIPQGFQAAQIGSKPA